MSDSVGRKLSARRTLRRSASCGALVALLALAACGSLLGIEDVHEGPAPGGDAGSGGSAGGRLGAGGGGTHPGGAANSTGADAGEEQSGGTDGGDTAGKSDGGNGGSAGGSGGLIEAGGSSAVHGHVIDFWGHQLPDVPVEIGGKLTRTDAQGAFSFADVPAEYDTSLVVSFSSNGFANQRGWVYQGLTRRDPTLQVYQGLEYEKGSLDVLPGEPTTLTDARTLTVATGGPDGSTEYQDVSGPGIDGATALWVGPTTTQQTAHALIWEPDTNSDFPTKYLAYDTALIGLSALTAEHSKAAFDLTPTVIASGLIGGTVVGNTADRSNRVFLRFTSNAVMTLVDHTPTTAGFSYLVPGIANASASVAASSGYLNTEYAIVHKDGLLPNTSNLTLTIPTPAKLLTVTPAADAKKVNASTQFSFKPGNPASAPFVAVFYHRGDVNDRLNVVSAKVPFTLPKVANGLYGLLPGETYSYRVATHGSPVSVDDMTGPAGFLDSFTDEDDVGTPHGPRNGDGSYTLSGYVDITLAP